MARSIGGGRHFLSSSFPGRHRYMTRRYITPPRRRNDAIGRRQRRRNGVGLSDGHSTPTSLAPNYKHDTRDKAIDHEDTACDRLSFLFSSSSSSCSSSLSSSTAAPSPVECVVRPKYTSLDIVRRSSISCNVSSVEILLLPHSRRQSQIINHHHYMPPSTHANFSCFSSCLFVFSIVEILSLYHSF